MCVFFSDSRGRMKLIIEFTPSILKKDEKDPSANGYFVKSLSDSSESDLLQIPGVK